jgi:hypothetical protein
VTNMTTMSPEVRRQKNLVGIVAIVILLVFTILWIVGFLPFLVCIIGDLAVALVANVLFRRIGRQQA